MEILETYKPSKVYHPPIEKLENTLHKMNVKSYNADAYLPGMSEISMMKQDLKKYGSFIVWLYKTTTKTDCAEYAEIRKLVEKMCGENYL